MSSSEDEPRDLEPYLPPQQFPQADDTGSICQLQQYERIRNSKGEKVLLQVGSTRARQTLTHDAWSPQAALILIKDMEDPNKPDKELVIQSSHIKAAMKECVPKYTNIDISRQSLILKGDPQCIFHFRHELIRYQEQRAKDGDTVAASHVRFLLDHMFNSLSSEIRHFTHLVQDSTLPPALHHEDLWMVFVPGELVYCTEQASSTKSSGRLYRFQSMMKVENNWWTRWFLTLLYIDHNGDMLGCCESLKFIDKSEGAMPLRELKVTPLRYHPDQEKIQSDILARGNRYLELHGCHYRQYDGVAKLHSDTRDQSFDGEDDYFPLRSVYVRGRIMIDGGAYVEAMSAHAPSFLVTEKRFLPQSRKHPDMTDEELMICNDVVRGFSLNDKKWGWFYVGQIRHVEFNSDAFDSLILKEDSKKTLMSLVTSHSENKTRFDDVIEGKGRSLVFLLHGDPGTGKTLTAESIADSTKLPLLRIDAAALGDSLSDIESSLARMFDLSIKWNAITLLDEADVFIEHRTSSDLQRNRLVAGFLRAIEYFEGILFLTTNRIQSFDKALRSRVHFALYYPVLDSHYRKEIWRNLLSRLENGVDLTQVQNGLLDLVAESQLNGRQIKNTVHMAQALALSSGEPVGYQHLDQALKSMKAFDIDCVTADREQDETRDTETSGRAKRKRRV